MKKYSGTCLCKKVGFTVEAEFSGFYFCHCSRCRKASGSAHGANLFAENAKLVWVSGEKNVRIFRLSETRFARAFCETCGSALPRTAGDNGIVVPAGSLDCDLETKPTAHIFVGSRANWDHGLEKVTKIEASPG